MIIKLLPVDIVLSPEWWNKNAGITALLASITVGAIRTVLQKALQKSPTWIFWMWGGVVMLKF